MKAMKILDENIELSHDDISIRNLKFLKDNPRVYACTHGEPNFENLSEEEQQEVIYKKLLKEPSVKNLLPEIKRHGGLMESILIRHDTMEVIEGNSRLAVYLKLDDDAKKDKHAEGDKWERIPCDIVGSLTDDQQAVFLNQIHVKGKTQWSAFEKANFAYVRREKGNQYKDIAKLFGESETTIRTRVNVIRMMKDNKDSELSHFSYYDVIVRNHNISEEVKEGGKLPNLLAEIKRLGSDEEDEESNIFTAQDLRKKIPAVLKKTKVLRKYQEGKYNLDQAYQLAKISDIEEKVKQATALLEDVSKRDIDRLEKNGLNAFKQAARKLLQAAKRIEKLVDTERMNSE